MLVHSFMDNHVMVFIISDQCLARVDDFTKMCHHRYYRKISLNQLLREMKSQGYHTTASHDRPRLADGVHPCAHAEMLQDAFSADARCTEVTAGQ